MKTTEILDRLQKAEFTAIQAREIAGILEGDKEEQVTKTDLSFSTAQLKAELQKEILHTKYDLVKWIVAGVIMNGIVSALLKYIG